MLPKYVCRASCGRAVHCHPQRAIAFSLVELLTVVFIISLLIGILIPSINSARNAAKRMTTAKALDSINVGLEMFKNDNAADFRQTNGYPPSFAHPPIGKTFLPWKGEFPFLPEASGGSPSTPTVYGAHWLPAMLMGVDNLGYVKRSGVPNKDGLREKPWLWYTPDPMKDGKPLERMPLYLDPGSIRTVATERLPGRTPEDMAELFPSWEEMKHVPVIVDAFEQPVLYYVSNTYGQPTNMLEDRHREDNDYSLETPQQQGMPFYFHEDNMGFTGTETLGGWDFGSRRPHAIARSGAELRPTDFFEADSGQLKADVRDTFARYILDRNIFKGMVRERLETSPLRPVNSETYLLISAGPDGRFGTNDDVSNLPPWAN